MTMQLAREKVDKILDDLKTQTGDEWFEEKDLKVIVNAVWENEQWKFLLDKGAVAKMFMNKRTGELRFYWIKLLKE